MLSPTLGRMPKMRSNSLSVVEGHFVGRLTGVRFEAAQGSSVLEEKALRAAAPRRRRCEALRYWPRSLVPRAKLRRE